MYVVHTGRFGMRRLSRRGRYAMRIVCSQVIYMEKQFDQESCIDVATEPPRSLSLLDLQN